MYMNTRDPRGLPLFVGEGSLSIVLSHYEMWDRVYSVWAHPTHGLRSMTLALRTRAEKNELPPGLGLAI